MTESRKPRKLGVYDRPSLSPALRRALPYLIGLIVVLLAVWLVAPFG